MKDGHGRKKRADRREYLRVKLDGMIVNENDREHAANAKREVAHNLQVLLKDRFDEGDIPLFNAFKILDPFHWRDNDKFGEDSLRIVLEHFEIPIKSAGIDEKLLFKEWHNIKRMV